MDTSWPRLFYLSFLVLLLVVTSYIEVRTRCKFKIAEKDVSRYKDRNNYSVQTGGRCNVDVGVYKASILNQANQIITVLRVTFQILGKEKNLNKRNKRGLSVLKNVGFQAFFVVCLLDLHHWWDIWPSTTELRISIEREGTRLQGNNRSGTDRPEHF